MANILVNGMKSKSGGGKAIFDTYLRLLIESRSDDHHYVLTPDRDAYRQFENDGVSIIDVPAWAHSNLATIPLYRLVFPRLLTTHRIDAILNFGDVVIPSNLPQLYNFDWAFAVYPNHESWQRLSWKERILYGVKLHFFKAYLSHATVIMAQTEAMKVRLEKHYDLPNVVVVPAAVDCPGAVTVEPRALALPDTTFRLIYPANYYPHKNIGIIEPVAELARERSLSLAIVTTLNEDEHTDAKAFLERCREKGLDSVIVNVGRLPGSEIPALYEAADALFMPTLLETFGLPYIEAMRHRKPILTSDRDFAHAVCGDAALYFDPANPASIVDAVAGLMESNALYRELVDRGQKILRKSWTWDSVFGEYQHLMKRMLSNAQI